jgi:hypothetical protein
MINKFQIIARLYTNLFNQKKHCGPEVIEPLAGKMYPTKPLFRLLETHKKLLLEAVHIMSHEPEGSPDWCAAYSQYKRSALVVQNPIFQSNTVRLVRKENSGYFH